VDGKLVNVKVVAKAAKKKAEAAGETIGDDNSGVNGEEMESGGDAAEKKSMGVSKRIVHLGNAGRGVNKQLVHLGNAGRGDSTSILPRNEGIYSWFRQLAARLSRVRVCSGDWMRVMGSSVTFKHGMTGIFLDPPYSFKANRANSFYREESGTVAHEVREWAIANGDNPLLRIALCGYLDEHNQSMPPDWKIHQWKAGKGYGAQLKTKGKPNDNQSRECIWFSPHCLDPSPTLELEFAHLKGKENAQKTTAA
jgi:hypothetical protein